MISASRIVGCIKARRLPSSRFFTVKLSEEVENAIAEKKPIVALESTIISHGMPYPRNLNVAKDCEQAIRDNGAVPATIAIIDGVPKVGLDEHDLMKLAKNDGSIYKASTRDLGYMCANKFSAATTVASTMRLAHMAGISVFATGGIGGVHRGAETTMDVSADLIELSRTPVTVVCAGIKSILDIRKSLEVLETHGVPVIGYTTKQFPAFFTNDSGVPSPLSVFYSPNIIADMMVHNRLLSLPNGMVVGVPNPQPANADKIQYAIDFAIMSAAEEGITGAAITPYVLSKIEHLTGGESLNSNIALVLNNCLIASQIAVEYANLKQTVYSDTKYHSYFGTNFQSVVGKSSDPVPLVKSARNLEAAAIINKNVEDAVSNVNKSVDHSEPVKEVVHPPKETVASIPSEKSVTVSPAALAVPNFEVSSSIDKTQQHDIVVVGGAVVDIIGNITSHTVKNTSNPGKLRISCGGVGRNIAESVARLGIPVTLGTAVADDISGLNILNDSKQLGIDVTNVKLLSSAASSPGGSVSASTAVYNAIHGDDGDLCIGVADMSIFTEIDTAYVESLRDVIGKSKVVVVDGNISVEAMRAVAKVCKEVNASIFFEPTSDHKCLLPFKAGIIEQIDMIKPNVSELVEMTRHCLAHNLILSGKSVVSRTVATILTNRQDKSNTEVDVSDVRILANAIHSVMSSGIPPKLPVAGAPTKGIFGKHVLVSMGCRGVLWCGPSKIMSSGNNALNKNSGIVVDDQAARANCHIPAAPIPAGAQIVHTNGAGDALCGGILAEIVTRINLHNIKQKEIIKDSKVQAAPLLLPDVDCIHQGIKNSLRWLTTKRD